MILWLKWLISQNLSQAAQCWRQAPDLAQALRVCDQCAELYIDLNKHCRAAKELNQMADAYRRLYGQTKSPQNADEAINLYKRAKELFIRDGYQGLKIVLMIWNFWTENQFSQKKITRSM